jgi:hypothetical protein
MQIRLIMLWDFWRYNDCFLETERNAMKCLPAQVFLPPLPSSH